MFPGFRPSSALLLICACSFPHGALAQTGSATISGTVSDSSGGKIPNAKVNAQSLETDASRSTTTSSAGVYSLTALRVGHYRVTIDAAGFQEFLVEDTQLQVGQNLTLDASLQIATATTSVDVSETAAPLDETSAAGQWTHDDNLDL